MNAIEKFFINESVGKCTDPNLEFGNMYRKNIYCNFCINGKDCHYNGECERREGSTEHIGWRTN